MIRGQAYASPRISFRIDYLNRRPCLRARSHQIMGSLLLVDRRSLQTEDMFENIEIPVWYMADYSLMGFVVDRLDDSIRILENAGYRLEHQRRCAMIYHDGAGDVLRIQRTLTESHIGTVYRDIAETFYQA